MEQISGTAFMVLEDLPAKDATDLCDGMSAAAALWNTALADPSWSQQNLKPHGRCIYSALAVCDILHAVGRTDAHPVRTGLDVRARHGSQLYGLTIGDPELPKLPRKINAHIVVKLGDMIIDPSFAQTRRPWNNSPHFVGFRSGAPDGETIDLNENCHARMTTVYRWSEGDRDYQVAYFKLPRKVDLATRGWCSAPDARPERRLSIVKKAIRIRLAEIGATAERNAA